MLLARRGYRVLLVDKATFPSDTISTHIVWPHGAEFLDRWGLLDRLAATGCPPVALNMTFDLGPLTLRGGIVDTNSGRGGFCPRRTVLDKLMVDAAAESGAEVREGFVVEELLRGGDRVVGLRGRTRNGASAEERARVVIGADGVHSFVARAVAAREYDTRPPIATYFYSYYSGFEAEDIEQHIRDYYGVGCFPTHDGLTLIAGVWPSRFFQQIRSNVEGHVQKVCDSIPDVAGRLRRARREEKWLGTAGVPNYYRVPFGPGWALVGDAGQDKDPIQAQGISDAFIDSESLADALDAGLSGRRPLDEALREHHEQRDRRTRPMYDFSCEMAALAPPPPPMRQLFAALKDNREATNEFFSAITGSRPLPGFMNPENIERIVSGAAVR
jgi:2-polyprenyl-6-methoxyphenol hydroxylase-like FAD-dependent oxidoreductase